MDYPTLSAQYRDGKLIATDTGDLDEDWRISLDEWGVMRVATESNGEIFSCRFSFEIGDLLVMTFIDSDENYATIAAKIDGMTVHKRPFGEFHAYSFDYPSEEDLRVLSSPVPIG